METERAKGQQNQKMSNTARSEQTVLETSFRMIELLR